jgi:hypothetical protein
VFMTYDDKYYTKSKHKAVFGGVSAERGLFLCARSRLRPDGSVVSGPERIFFAVSKRFSLHGGKPQANSNFHMGRPHTTKILCGPTGNQSKRSASHRVPINLRYGPKCLNKLTSRSP